MTPLPSKSEVALRHVFDQPAGTIHIKDLINLAKDGFIVKDKLSDHYIGLILVGRGMGFLEVWEGSLFQMPFKQNLKLRRRADFVPHCGQPFLGPDGKVMVVQGRVLCGGGPGAENLPVSDLTIDSIIGYPNWSQWVQDTFWTGGWSSDAVYDRVHTFDSKTECDEHVNSRPYIPGIPPSSAFHGRLAASQMPASSQGLANNSQSWGPATS